MKKDYEKNEVKQWVRCETLLVVAHFVRRCEFGMLHKLQSLTL